MKGKLSIARTAGIILAVIQLILSGILSVQLLKMLPLKYWGIWVIAAAILFLIVLLLQFGKGIHWLGKILSVILIVTQIAGLIYLSQTNRMLHDITTVAKVEKDQILVVVKKESPAKSLEDLKDASWGVQYANDVEMMGKAVDSVSKELNQNLDLTAYDDYQALYPALMQDQVDAMFLNSSYLEVIDDLTMEEDQYLFSDKIRIIKTLEFETKVEEADTKDRQAVDVTKDPFLVYISGIDTYGDISTKSRSDVNILMTVNPTTRQILLVTTPRDAYVVLPGISGKQKDKLTHSGIYGIDCSMDTMDSIYDTHINFYARVNFNSLMGIVDALDGVDVYSAYDFSVGDQHFTKGYNHLNGEQALTFSRERHSFKDGDFQRGRDQMEVIKGIVNKATTPAILGGFSEILKEVSSQVQTSLTTDELYALVKMQLEDPRGWELFSYETQANGAREYCYSYTGKSLYVGKLVDSSVSQAKKLIQEVFDGKTITETDVRQ